MVLALALNVVPDTEGSDFTGEFWGGGGKESIELNVSFTVYARAVENIEVGF